MMTHKVKDIDELVKAKTMSKKRRLGLTFLFMTIFAVIFQLGTMATVELEEAQQLMAAFEEQIKNIDAIGIFVHNTTITLAMFLPGIGTAIGLLTSYQTGYALAAATVIEPSLAGFPPLLLFITPFGFMEIFAYSLAMSRSYLLIRHAIKLRKIFIKPLVIEVGIVVGLLLAGGYIEFGMIQWANEMGFNMMEMIG